MPRTGQEWETKRLPISDSIEKTIERDAAVEKVWRALTDHHEFGACFRVTLDNLFLPGQVTTGYLTCPGYEHLKWEATVKEMASPRLFSFSWHPYAVDPGRNYSEEPPTLVEFRLGPTARGTRRAIAAPRRCG